MRQVIILLGILFFLSGCCVSKTGTKKLSSRKSEKMIYKVLINSALYGNGKEGIASGGYVIKNQKSWKELLDKMGRVNKIPEILDTSRIDFSDQMLVAVFSRVMGSGGVEAKVQDVTQDCKHIRVKTDFESMGRFGIAVMSQPYTILVLKKSNKEVIFEIN